jgi:hypothetical protein
VSGDLLGDAVAELYSADPDEFIERRTHLTGQAKAAGQPLAARQIAGLRKPTRSAWVINQLARSDPDSAPKLAALGERLRAAERSGDGARMRELTQQRRQLIAALVRQALAVSGQSAAPAALREEITATFAAALADPEVAEQIQQGTLVRAASRPGFGSSQAPLALVPPIPGAQKEPAGKKPRADPARSRPTAPVTQATPPSPAQPSRAAQGRQKRPAAQERQPARAAQERQPARAAQERQPARAGQERPVGQAPQERQNKLALAAERREARLAEAAARAEAQAAERRAKVRAAAEQALADADQAAAAAVQDEREQAETVRRLEHELSDARYRLRMAAAEVRRAEAAQHKARQALDRLADQP